MTCSGLLYQKPYILSQESYMGIQARDYLAAQDAEQTLVSLLEQNSYYHPTLGHTWLENVVADIRNLLHANKFAKALAQAQSERINTLVKEKNDLIAQLERLQMQALEVRQVGIRCCKEQ